MDNSIRLKELQVVNGFLKKGDEGFQKSFDCVRKGRWGTSTFFQKIFFKKGLGKVIFFGMGTNPRVCFLGNMGGRNLVVLQGTKVRFYFLISFSQGISFLVVWSGVVGKWGWVYSFFFCDMVI